MVRCMCGEIPGALDIGNNPQDGEEGEGEGEVVRRL